MKLSVIVTLAFLTLVSILHLMRFALQMNITVQTFVVPMWASVVAFLFVGWLAVWLWREARPAQSA